MSCIIFTIPCSCPLQSHSHMHAHLCIHYLALRDPRTESRAHGPWVGWPAASSSPSKLRRSGERKGMLLVMTQTGSGAARQPGTWPPCSPVGSVSPRASFRDVSGCPGPACPGPGTGAGPECSQGATGVLTAAQGLDGGVCVLGGASILRK